MKKYFIVALVLFSCNGQQKTSSTASTGDQTKVETTGDNKPVSISSGCYRMVIGKDTATMKLNLSGSSADGDLDYKRFEKDSNHGTFKGSIEGDKLIIWYNYSSEGMNTVRQTIFKISGESFSEGYGDVKQQHDTVLFSYPRTLSYEEKHPFTRVTCP